MSKRPAIKIEPRVVSAAFDLKKNADSDHIELLALWQTGTEEEPEQFVSIFEDFFGTNDHAAAVIDTIITGLSGYGHLDRVQIIRELQNLWTDEDLEAVYGGSNEERKNN